MFRDRFFVCLLLTIPTLVWGHMLQGALGYTAPQFPGSTWIPAIFGTAVFAYGGRVFIQGAIRELRMALQLVPGYRPARMELHRLLGLLN